MDQRLRLVTLGVRDLPAARAFYVDGLGWHPTLDLPEIVFIQIGHGLLLGLFPVEELIADAFGPDAGVPPPDPGAVARFSLAHNVDSEAEVEAEVERARAAGATIVKPPQQAAFGGFHAYLTDHDSNLWEIAYNPGLTVDPDGTVRFIETGA